jgi:hypothetical protein
LATPLTISGTSYRAVAHPTRMIASVSRVACRRIPSLFALTGQGLPTGICPSIALNLRVASVPGGAPSLAIPKASQGRPAPAPAPIEITGTSPGPVHARA